MYIIAILNLKLLNMYSIIGFAEFDKKGKLTRIF
jgi:hypothetical protein